MAEGGAACAADDQAWAVEQDGAGVGDLDVGAVCEGFEEAQEGDLVRGEADRGEGGGPDLRNVDGAAGEGGEDEAVREALVASEAERRLGRGHCCGLFSSWQWPC